VSTEENKALVQRFFSLLNSGAVGAAGALLDPGFRLRMEGDRDLDVAGALEFFQGFLQFVPGIHIEIVSQIAEGDLVATEIDLRGTPHVGFVKRLLTSEEITIGAANIHRIVDGRIVEHRLYSNAAAMFQRGAFGAAERA
jgi:predicted SnoaL-like aldol condensation-catalyzing enzyme